MPYVRIWVTEEEKDDLMRLAHLEEDDQARDEQRPKRRVRVADAVRGCFVEGLEDLKVRQPSE